MLYVWGDFMSMGKKGLSAMKIVYVVIGLVIGLQVLVALLPTASSNINGLLTNVSSDSTAYGAGPASLASVFTGIWGYVLVAGMIGFVIMAAKKFFGGSGKI